MISEIHHPVYLYIDNIDEAFNIYLSTAKAKPHLKAENVWIFSQIGLMEAAKEILQFNRHIKVYASIRLEAYQCNKGPTFLQMDNYTCVIAYSKEEVERIFFQNVSSCLGSKVETDSNELLKMFFNFKTLPHPIVSEDGRPAQEHLFNYLYRHTFRRPREIVYIGKAVSETLQMNRTTDKVRDVVNKCALRFIEQYRFEVAHAFDEDELKAVCSEVRSTVISRETLDMARKRLQKSCPAVKDIFSSLYRKGLFGYVSKDASNRAVQFFLPVAEHIFDEHTTLPKANYYLVHPALAELLQSADSSFVVDCNNIVGYDCVFHEVALANDRATNGHEYRQQPERYCVGFGAGKIGLGLIADLFLSQQPRLPIAIVQRDSKAQWKNVAKHEEVMLRRNGTIIGTFHVVSQASPPGALDLLISEKKNVLLLTENPQLTARILKAAKFVTSSLAEGLGSLETHLINASFVNDINVYPFENEYGAVQKLRKNLENKRVEHVHIVPVSVDRVCAGLSFCRDGQCIDVTTEEYRDVIVSQINRNVAVDFERTDGVRVSKPDVFDLERRKKFYIVNTLHMVLVAYGVSYLISQKKLGPSAIMSFPTNVFPDIEEIRNRLSVFGSLQCVRFLMESPADTLEGYFHSHDKSLQYDALMEYVARTVERFGSFPDEVHRLFPLAKISGLKNKFEERINKIGIYFAAKYRHDADAFKEFRNFSLQEKQIKEYITEYLSHIGIIAMYYGSRQSRQSRRSRKLPGK